MNYSDILQHKTEIRDKLKTKFSFPRRPKVIVLIHLQDDEMRDFLTQWLSVLPVNFIVVWKNTAKTWAKNIAYVSQISKINLDGIDAMICDNESGKIEAYMQRWIVPIVCDKNYLGKILTEFSAARGEGNAYIYETNSKWSAYYALVRYLENHKFPYDNRNLVKNVVWM